MKKNFKYIMLALIALMGFSLTSCNDDDVTLSRKVLASVDVLEYDGETPDVQTIRVVSDGDWVAEAPEWVMVSPASGTAGETDVEITVKDNFRDGALDNPRRANLIFRGRSIDSNATVIIRQDGDKWRDPIDYTIDEVEAASDETVVLLPNVVVTAVTGKGYVVSDGTKFAYVPEATTPVSVGDNVSVLAEKFTDTMKMTYLVEEKTTVNGTAALPSIAPFDITSTLDSTNGTTYQYVTLVGDWNGVNLVVGDNKSKVIIIDANPALEVEKLSGHKIRLTGYFAGQASPVVNIIPSAVEDLGVNEIVYLYDDFEWLEPWTSKGNGSKPAADIVGTNGADTEQPQISSNSCIVDGQTAEEALNAKGYTFLRDWADGKSKSDCVYTQRNYLKFGKTSYQGGIILPKIAEFGDGAENVVLRMDVCSQRQGTGIWDPTTLVVVIEEDGSTKQIPVPDFTPADNAEYKWYHMEIALPTVTKNTVITIRNSDDQIGSGSALRWHLDNLKISSSND